VSWNPYGTHSFSLSARVTNVNPGPAESGSVTSVAAGQPGAAVLVDLDPEQQMVSQIIGMRLTITVGSGSVTGTFVPVNFVDIYFNRIGGTNPVVKGDGRAGAAFQSVLTGLQWKERESPFLRALKAASAKRLSIRFNVDAYNMFAGTPTFNEGRVAGTIGPHFNGEPASFTNARFLRPAPGAAADGWNYAPAKVDLRRRKLIVDLGNATSWTWGAKKPAPSSTVKRVQVATISFKGKKPKAVIDPFPQRVDTSDAAYEANAFVQELDIPASILPAIGSTPLGIVANGTIVLAENPSGAYANADPYVFRLNPGDRGQVTIWANRFGKPAAKVKLALDLDPKLLRPQVVGKAKVGTPANGVAFPRSVTTGDGGRAAFTIKAGNPRNARKVYNIDGQVYPIVWRWNEDVIPDGSAFISAKVFDTARVPALPTWWRDVFPILLQYAYLYPAMQEIFHLDDYPTVVRYARQIIARLDLPEDDPEMMPITRELSAAKRAILVKWAADPKHPQGRKPVPPPYEPPLPPKPGT